MNVLERMNMKSYYAIFFVLLAGCNLTVEHKFSEEKIKEKEQALQNSLTSYDYKVDYKSFKAHIRSENTSSEEGNMCIRGVLVSNKTGEKARSRATCQKVAAFSSPIEFTVNFSGEIKQLCPNENKDCKFFIENADQVNLVNQDHLIKLLEECSQGLVSDDSNSLTNQLKIKHLEEEIIKRELTISELYGKLDGEPITVVSIKAQSKLHSTIPTKQCVGMLCDL